MSNQSSDENSDVYFGEESSSSLDRRRDDPNRVQSFTTSETDSPRSVIRPVDLFLIDNDNDSDIYFPEEDSANGRVSFDSSDDVVTNERIEDVYYGGGDSRSDSGQDKTPNVFLDGKDILIESGASSDSKPKKKNITDFFSCDDSDIYFPEDSDQSNNNDILLNQSGSFKEESIDLSDLSINVESDDSGYDPEEESLSINADESLEDDIITVYARPITTKNPNLIIDWNFEFQSILQLPESYDKFRRLSNLYRDFVYSAKMYGKIIISEKSLQDDQKIIKSLSVGGRAGGIKYIAHGILFKFAVDTRSAEYPFNWMYGLRKQADDKAAKSAGHELKGLINCLNTVPVAGGIQYPLMCTIEYHGFRLIALSFLPINSNTLKYGSADGGRTVHHEIPQLNTIMKKVGQSLNIQGHYVGSSQEQLWMCGDIEGHFGLDSVFYCIDFARVFPPELLPREIRDLNVKGKYNYILYQLLRPELVKSNPIPLNPDYPLALFSSNKDERLEGREYVKQATQRLLYEEIPKFGDYLARKLTPVQLNKSSFSLTNELHRHGINCRHLGRVRQELKSNDVSFKRQFVLMEIAARTAKNHLRVLWRDTLVEKNMPCSQPYLEVTVDYFNKLLRDKEYWSIFENGIKSKIQESFHSSLYDFELFDDYDLRDSFSLSTFFTRLQEVTKVKLTSRINEQLAQSVDLHRLKILQVDIHKMGAKVKKLDLIDLCEGKMLYIEAQDEENNLEQAQRLFKMADEKFSAAIASNTNKPEILYWWAKSVLLESKRQTEVKEIKSKLTEAYLLIQKCCELLPDYIDGLFMKAKILINLAGYSQSKIDEWSYFTHAKETIELIALLDLEKLTLDLKENCDDYYNDLKDTHIFDPIDPRVLIRLGFGVDRFSSTKETKEEMSVTLARHAIVYFAHQLYLIYDYNTATVCKTVDILKRWAHVYISSGDKLMADLMYARAGQMLDLLLASSRIKFPLKDDKYSTCQFNYITLDCQRGGIQKEDIPNFFSSANSLSKSLATSGEIAKVVTKLTGNFVSGYLDLKVKRGVNKHRWKQFWCEFRDGNFHYSKNRFPEMNTLEKDYNSFQVEKIGKISDKTHPHCFYIESEDGAITIWRTETLIDRQSWIKFIELNSINISRYDSRTNTPEKKHNKRTALSKSKVVHFNETDNELPDSKKTLRRVSTSPILDPHQHSRDMTFTIELVSLSGEKENKTVTSSRIQQVFPTIRNMYSQDIQKDPQLLFHSNSQIRLSRKFTTYLDFDFARLALERIDFFIANSQLKKLEDKDSTLAKVIIWVTDDYPSDKKIQMFHNEDETTLLEGEVLFFDLAPARTQKFQIIPTEGNHFFLKIIPVSVIYMEQIAFYGEIKSNMIFHLDSNEVECKILNNFSSGYHWLASALRISEYSVAMKHVLRTLLKNTSTKENKVRADYKFRQFKRDNSYLCFSDDVKNDQPGVDFTKMLFPESDIVNTHVLSEFGNNCNCTTINLSNTKVFDKHLLALLKHNGYQIRDLILKKCENLTKSTLLLVNDYCSNLFHLGTWDLSEEESDYLAYYVPNNQNMKYLDLSDSHVTPLLLTNLIGLKYADLSRISGDNITIRDFRKFVSHCNTLEGIKLTRTSTELSSDHFQMLFNDANISSLLRNTPLLKFLDLSYCRLISDESISSLSTCTKLNTLILIGCSDFSADLLTETVRNTKSIEHFEMRKHGDQGLILNDFCAAVDVTSLKTLVLQGQEIDDSAFSKIIKKYYKSLKRINIATCQKITGTSARYISRCTKLVELNLQGCEIEENVLNEIFTSCLELRIILLDGCNVTDKSMEILLIDGRHQSKKSIHTLGLSGCSLITSKMFPYLYKHTLLRVLTLGRSEIVTTDTLVEISQSLRYLQILDITLCTRLPKKIEQIQGILNLFPGTLICHESLR